MADPTRPPKKRRRLSKVADTSEVVEPLAPTNDSPAKAPTAEEKPKDDQRRSLFVRSLAPETTTETLAEHFSQSYPIKHAVAVIDREKKTCKGFGFVTFTDPEDALKACTEYHGSELLGRKIKVEIAEARHREENGDKTAEPATKSKRGQQSADARDPPRLIVRNLPWSIKEPEQLAKLFLSYGKVKHVTIPKKGGKMIGFGVVLIRGRKNAEKAIAGVNRKEIDGRTLAVDWAVDKESWQQVKNDTMAREEEARATEALNSDHEDGGAGDDNLLDVEMEDAGSEAGSDDGDFVRDRSEADEGDASTDQDEDEPVDDNISTIFVRNLPFSCTDEILFTHFRRFGPCRYARVVYDPATERPRGTGFVCFVSPEVCATCLKDAPRQKSKNPKKMQTESRSNAASVLQNEYLDATGDYTMEGRVLQVSQAVGKSEAAKLTTQANEQRNSRDRDKRRLYLLNEGTIPSNSELYKKLSPSEIAMRESSLKQRKTLIQSNPSLHLSLTRLAIRNIPRSVTSRHLKTLAREAVVGFATDVKAGARKPLSKEERMRDFDVMKEADHERRLKQKGIIRQAKVVFEGREGSKVKESEGAGRSRGYGFIEYYTHRSALMGLRWLNGHAISKRLPEPGSNEQSKEDLRDLKRRLIVEFAIENAQVVGRRREREVKARSHEGANASTTHGSSTKGRTQRRGQGAQEPEVLPRGKGKRKRSDAAPAKVHEPEIDAKDGKSAKRNRIIAKKRHMRRTRKDTGGKV